jgi:hypothetical protein
MVERHRGGGNLTGKRQQRTAHLLFLAVALGTRGCARRCRRRRAGERQGAAQGLGLAAVGQGQNTGPHVRRGVRGGGTPGGARVGERAAAGAAAAGQRGHDTAVGAGGLCLALGGGAARETRRC